MLESKKLPNVERLCSEKLSGDHDEVACYGETSLLHTQEAVRSVWAVLIEMVAKGGTIHDEGQYWEGAAYDRHSLHSIPTRSAPTRPSLVMAARARYFRIRQPCPYALFKNSRMPSEQPMVFCRKGMRLLVLVFLLLSLTGFIIGPDPNLAISLFE